MTRQESDEGLDFEALRRCIEWCDADGMLGFYAEDARITIFDARGPRTSRPFELRGKVEIARHLRAVYGQRASHRVGREGVVGEGRLAFREACEYPDGGRLVVETTLDVRDGKILRQTDSVSEGAGTEATSSARRPGSGRAAEKEDLL